MWWERLAAPTTFARAARLYHYGGVVAVLASWCWRRGVDGAPPFHYRGGFLRPPFKDC
jgi:hypothetical protein